MSEPISLQYSVEDGLVTLAIRADAAITGTAVVEFESDRNATISRLSDVSPFAPRAGDDRAGGPQPSALTEELWFPVVDIDLGDEQLYGIARLSAPRSDLDDGVVALNSFAAHRSIQPLGATVTFDHDVLEHWENAAFISRADVVLDSFVLARSVALDDGATEVRFRPLSEDWCGVVRVSAGGVTGSVTVDLGRERSSTAGVQMASSAAQVDGTITTGDLAVSLGRTLEFLRRAENHRPGSRTEGGGFLLYDLDARTFRTSHWNWTWGPQIRLLLDARAVAATHLGMDPQALLGSALALGSASLRFQIDDPKHPADGISIVRWQPGVRVADATGGYLSPADARFASGRGWVPSHPDHKFDHGYASFASPADALFLLGWGWVPLYEASGDERFLAAGRRLVDASAKLLDEFELVPQDYLMLQGEWTPMTREESGFGTEGLAELYRVTQDRSVRELADRYMSQMLAKLERPDGLWNRHWYRDTGRVTTCEYKSRSLGWATEGLLAAHRACPDGEYLHRAQAMAEHFLAAQRPDGCWPVIINRPVEEVGSSSKGTALWSLLMYRLYRASGDDRYLASARRALGWLLRNQYEGDDMDARGSVVSCDAFSGINYRQWFRISCSYTSAFFGLAVLEELRLRGTLGGL